MKKFILQTKYDFIHHVKPKWKFFGTIVLTLAIINSIFYVLTHSNRGVANPDDHAFIYVIYAIIPFMNITFVCMYFKEYVHKDFLRIKNDMKKSFQQEVMMKDETLYKLADLYKDAPDYLKSQLVSILFESALIKKRKTK